MRCKMYALALASVLVIASTGCQAIRTSSCGSGSNISGATNCSCQNCQNSSAFSGSAAGYQSAQSGDYNSVGNSGGTCNCQNGMCHPAQSGGGHSNGFARNNGEGLFGAGGHAGANGAGGMGMGGGIDLSACPGCSRLGQPCAKCLAPGGRLSGLAGGAAGKVGKARGLFGSLINRAAAHDCQTPYTQPFADSGLPGGPMTPTYGYPYYTTRAPRDFFTCNPPSIGP